MDQRANRRVDCLTCEVEQKGLNKIGRVAEGLLTLPTQPVRLVQNPRNPLLLRQRRKRNLKIPDVMNIQTRNAGAKSVPVVLSNREWRVQEVF